MNSDLTEKIRERAYALWVEEGRQDGRQDEYWLRAEREVLAEDRDGRVTQPDDSSVFTVPDSEMLSGEPAPGEAHGGPSIATAAAAGVAPAPVETPEVPKRKRATRARATAK